jgi:hypothetical protein
MPIPIPTRNSVSKLNMNKIIISARKLFPLMTAFATSQMITSILFSCWEHTKLQISTFLKHISFGVGFEENVTVIATRPVSSFKF